MFICFIGNRSYSIRQYTTCPTFNNETIYFDKNIYTIVSEVSMDIIFVNFSFNLQTKGVLKVLQN